MPLQSVSSIQAGTSSPRAVSAGHRRRIEHVEPEQLDLAARRAVLLGLVQLRTAMSGGPHTEKIWLERCSSAGRPSQVHRRRDVGGGHASASSPALDVAARVGVRWRSR